ncbi:MAG TPA: hypothetical protein VFQ58_08605, partial [Flavisolibacter sp.]|nr:hypothetical protein [Flavisolibacter sp.]
CNNKIILVAILLFNTIKGLGQEAQFTSEPKRGEYSIVAYISTGASYFPSRSAIPTYLNAHVIRVQSISTIRLLWFPDHMVKVGIETGHIGFFSYTLTDSAGNKGKIALSAIPILLEWSMSVTKHFNIFAGSGGYILRTRLDFAGKSQANKFSVGWMAAASYILPLSKNTGLGSEFKWLYAAETSQGSVCLQIQFVWKFLKW